MEVHRFFTFLLPTVVILLTTLLPEIRADDAAVMSDLLSSLTPTPPKWSAATSFCDWNGIGCDSSKKSVTSININSFSVSGSLPAGLNQLSQLKTLAAQKNSLSGPLPTLAGLAYLQEVYLDNNNFTEIPADCFNGLSSLTFISIGDNLNLSPWEIPMNLTGSPNLGTFYASNTNLVGSIPDFFGAFSSLVSLRLSYNKLTGSLPSSFAGSEIQNLWLNDQAAGLSGTIDVLGKMNQVSQVWLHKNAFTGAVPDLSNCTSLVELQLRDNQFTGVLPDTLTRLTSLQNITLQNNKFQGPYPNFSTSVHATLGTSNSFCLPAPGPCDAQVTTLLEVAGALGYPWTLADSWEGNDACKPWSFITCDAQGKSVTMVKLGLHKFNGTISPAFGNLTALKQLFLNDNNLTGPIPDSLSLTQLEVLDVSNNNLSGKEPTFTSRLRTFKKDGNPLLGKDPSPPPGPGANPPSGSSSGSSKGAKIGTVIAIVVAVLIFAAGMGCFIWWKCFRKTRREFHNVENLEKGKNAEKNGVIGLNQYAGVQSELQSQTSGDNNDVNFLDGRNDFSIQILRKVTNNFSPDNILGRGGFGVVYKGEMPDGSKIAVKRMESAGLSNKGLKEFQAEIAVLTKVRHRHLVALLGYCITSDERLLVYEYMPQGTLSQHLFETKGDDGDGYSPLSWKQRVTIALDVARGVEYLHSLARESFIHRDLKPSNILLGDDMRAKVADFGLVKHSPDGNYSMETRLAGTFGYLAPEYATTGRVTTKVDVYAFGVVLMEIITGRKALDENVADERAHLVSWFRRVLVNKNNLPKAIDQTLESDEETFTSICKVAELAGHCTAREPFQRPDMGHAVNILGPLVEEWKPGCHERDEEDEDGSFGIDLGLSLPEALQRWQANEGSTSTMDTNFFNTGQAQTQSTSPTSRSAFHSSISSGR